MMTMATGSINHTGFHEDKTTHLIQSTKRVLVDKILEFRDTVFRNWGLRTLSNGVDELVKTLLIDKINYLHSLLSPMESVFVSLSSFLFDRSKSRYILVR